jgi:hypothetical protein
MSKKYGNDIAWCFLEDGWETTRLIEIWHPLGKGEEEVMAYASDKYNAMQIVDAILIADSVKDDPENKLTKRETLFLQFVSSNCPEPWATMADNAIMWNDREVFKNIKAKFNEIY